MIAELRTPRLELRAWTDSDLAPFANLNSDPQVMEYFPGTLSHAESDDMVARIRERMSDNGWGLWAVERKDTGEFIGCVGLNIASWDTHVEVGWRLARAHWGHGFATEAALAALRHGFEVLELDEIVSYTVPANRRSQAVMKRIGMRRDQARDFEHPRLPEGHPLRFHVVHVAEREPWLAAHEKLT